MFEFRYNRLDSIFSSFAYVNQLEREGYMKKKSKISRGVVL